MIFLKYSFINISLPGQFVQIGEYSLGNIFYEVVIHIQCIDVGQASDRVPGHLGEVVVTKVQILQRRQEVIKGMGRYGVELVVGQNQVA